ncbi:ribonuclease R [Rubinisphaera sp. JC750]|uniref:ribonuclease R n=1 Tax=Rubinisphaera sp. JC750 TaxID=2898658 RepID=UPI001F0119B9|nr:ribonuclease R [Rubinisphaera sp. JC750]
MTSLQQDILNFVGRDGYTPLKAKTLGKKLGVKKKHFQEFEEALHDLIASEQLEATETGKIKAPGQKHGLQGILRKVSTGNGYVVLHEPKPADLTQDIFIDARDLGDAQTGDEVIVYLNNRRKTGGQRCGRIAEVVERATNRFVGVYFEEDGQGYVFIDGVNYEEAIWVGDPGAKGAKTDDKVVIEMIRFPTNAHVGEAVLVEVLGARGNPGVDTLSIIHEYGLPTEFDEKALNQARQQAEDFDKQTHEDRLDLTEELIVTIDPKDARDFDDAISLTRSDDGHFHLGVHIADVSHFVQPNTPLDDEAYKRGTSVYLPTQVIPMLPEVLSNGLASLQQGRLRLVKSVFIEFNKDGVPLETRFANSKINVKQRFAYEQVQHYLDNAEARGEELEPAVAQILMDMQHLARMLRKRRFSAGALELNMPEVRLSFDDDGRVSGAFQAEHDESHRIIEEFMLAANVAVAQELNDRGVLFLRRTHGEPREEKLKLFREFVESLGLTLDREHSRHDLQKLLDQTAHTPLERSVHFAFLRSLKQAIYSIEDEGHFALAAENYCHFTSPIRRYPDLTVHRIIDRLIIRGEQYKGESYEKLEKISTHCSTTERRAERAERELTKIKLLEYMESKIGSEFDAVITGVERFGIFCQCLEIPAEGMIHISQLGSIDHFYFERESHALIGKRTDVRLRLGSMVRVKVVHVDIDRRQLDMALLRVLKDQPAAGPKGKKKTSAKKNTPRKNTKKRVKRKR